MKVIAVNDCFGPISSGCLHIMKGELLCTRNIQINRLPGGDCDNHMLASITHIEYDKETNSVSCNLGDLERASKRSKLHVFNC